MVLQQTVRDVMTSPVLVVTPETELQDAVSLLTEHHVSGLAVVNGQQELIGELTEQNLMVRESGVDAGPYVMLLDSVIYLRNPLNWDKQVHQVLGNRVKDLMTHDSHSCLETLPLPKAAALLHERSTQRLYVVNGQRQPVGVITRGDVVRALAAQGS